MNITDILQYPVKGLTSESLSSIKLEQNIGMPADRVFAIAHGNTQFSFSHPAWVPRKNFAVVARSPEICSIQATFNHQNQTLTLSHHDSELMSEHVGSNDIDTKLTEALNQVIKTGQTGPYRLVRAGNTRMTDIPTPTVSIMNTQSLTALQDAVGQPLSKERFRGNIWFNGTAAWQEHDWVGKTIQIGDVKLYVTERIQRCAAIDANPELGTRDLNLLKQLNQHFNHTDFGVLAEVEHTGAIRQGDPLVE